MKSINTEAMQIDKTGKVTITVDGITVEGFEFFRASCRDGAIMACAWAIGELQREMLKCIQSPGGGNVAVEE